MAGSLTAGVKELARFDFIGRQKVRWDKGGTVRVQNYIISCNKETKISLQQILLYTIEYLQFRQQSLLAVGRHIQGVTGGTDQTSGGCSLC
jgi:hypothetical protein